MAEAKSAFKEGLEDIVATSSSICYIDGEKGILSYRGYNIHDLARHSTFEETAHLLWFGALPTRPELADTRRQMAMYRGLPREVQDFLWGMPKEAVPMDVLRTAVSHLSLFDPDLKSSTREANVRKAFRLTGQVASIVAAFHRLRQGRSYVEPRPELSHAANLLYLLNGEMPSSTAQRAYDIALILHAEHELNASTSTARAAAATLSDMHSAILERSMRREKRLNANVDFYSASRYYMLGIPIDLYTSIFAVSRISGWTAHVIDQHAHARLIRRRAEYTGGRPNVPYVPIQDG